MEILFQQQNTSDKPSEAVLREFGIEQCILKNLSFKKDRSSITRKSHSHMSFEIHIIEEGYQIYRVTDKTVRVESGESLLIPPDTKHLSKDEDPCTRKHAITFKLSEGSFFEESAGKISSCVIYRTPACVEENLRVIQAESARRDPCYSAVVGYRVWECILAYFRLSGINNTQQYEAPAQTENEILFLAKQYIEDNVCRRISLSELASYCCISEKQLERIFHKELRETVMEHIRRKRCTKIEQLLSDPTLSLREVSEIMGFNNEYYFNTFFKKYSGMTPGAYRKSVRR